MRAITTMLLTVAALAACNHVDGPLPQAPRATYGVTVVSQSSPCTVMLDLTNDAGGGGLRLSVALGATARDSLVLGSGRYVRDVTVMVGGLVPEHVADSVTVPGSAHFVC